MEDSTRRKRNESLGGQKKSGSERVRTRARRRYKGPSKAAMLQGEVEWKLATLKRNLQNKGGEGFVYTGDTSRFEKERSEKAGVSDFAPDILPEAVACEA